MKLFLLSRQTIIVITSLSLFGCALFGPTYKKPQVTVANNWTESANNVELIAESTNILINHWWTQFNDSTLNQYVESALNNNNDLQTAIGNITVAAGKLQQVNMQWVPTVNLSGGAGYGETFNNTNSISNQTINSLTSGIPLPNNQNNFNFYSGGLIPSYSLNVFQQIKAGEAAQAHLNLALANKNAVKLAVISQVVGSYFTILAISEQITLQQQLIDNLTGLEAAIKVEAENGLATQTDVNDYQQKLFQAKMQLPSLKYNLVASTNALAVLTDQNSAAILGTNKFSQINLNNKIPLNLPAQVLARRPDIQIAENQLKVANANIGVATSNFFPRIALTTPLGGYNTQLGSLFSANGDFWAAQINATMPILNLGLYGLVKQAKGQYYIAYYNYIKAVRQAFADINNSLSNYDNMQQTMREANNLYNSAQANAKLSTLSYQTGYIANPTNLANQISYNNAQLLYSQTKLHQLQSIIGLYQALGAGYDETESQTAVNIKKFGDSRDS
jgi:NodT family efflux transporter outer membrane factor (OMF) lipoprotein